MTAAAAPALDSDPHPLLTSLRRDGYVIIPSILSPAELSTLRDASARLTAVARSGTAWPHVRTVGKQFPPWDASLIAAGQTPGIWGVQHLLHPDLPASKADRDAFVGCYFHERILKVAGELLGLDDAEVGEDNGMTMELFNMLVRPDGDAPFALRWHRDDIPATATPEEELARLQVNNPGNGTAPPPYTHAQWNLPLHPDDSLIVVPGSHARARTETERAADPYADHLPGQIKVQLQPGDVVFYDNNILHRGVYDVERERLTLHGSVGRAGGSAVRARNVLQHGVGAWVDRCDFEGLDKGEGGKRRREVAEGMRRRLVALGRENEGKDVGYSLEG